MRACWRLLRGPFMTGVVLSRGEEERKKGRKEEKGQKSTKKSDWREPSGLLSRVVRAQSRQPMAAGGEREGLEDGNISKPCSIWQRFWTVSWSFFGLGMSRLVLLEAGLVVQSAVGALASIRCWRDGPANVARAVPGTGSLEPAMRLCSKGMD